MFSIPSKVFYKIRLDRIDATVDQKLRQEQAGFRRGRGCIDQLFELRNIIDQYIEWNTINFIDFWKAFESLHHDTLWKILAIIWSSSNNGHTYGDILSLV